MRLRARDGWRRARPPFMLAAVGAEADGVGRPVDGGIDLRQPGLAQDEICAARERQDRVSTAAEVVLQPQLNVARDEVRLDDGAVS